MTFLNPLDALIPKIPFSFFPDFWVWVTSKAWGSDSVGFWGSCQLSPFWGRGGGPAGGLYRPPPPPETKTRPPLQKAKKWPKGIEVCILQMNTDVDGATCPPQNMGKAGIVDTVDTVERDNRVLPTLLKTTRNHPG